MKKTTLIILILNLVQMAFAQNPSWNVNPSDFAYNGSITGKVYLNTEPVNHGKLGAFYGGECRGVANITYYPYYVFPMTCYSNTTSGETLTFKYYDNWTDEVYDLTETIEFVSGMIVGSETNPYVFDKYYDFIILDPGSEYVSSLAGAYTVNVESNVSWTVAESCDWLDCSPLNGSNDGSFTITCSENPLASSRDCDIIVSDGAISETHIFEQAGLADPFLTVSPEYYNYDTILMETCSDSIPFVVKNIGGSIATGYYNISTFLQFSVHPPPGSFSIAPGDSLILYMQYCPVSLDGRSTTLIVSGTGNTNTVKAHLIGWTYCKKVITNANPPEGGITTPQTTFIQEIYYKCIDAEANPGYEFVNWEQDGVIVSTDPHYCADYHGDCTFEPFLLTANFQDISYPLITIIPLSHNFGEVEVGIDSTFTFELKNDGGTTATGLIHIEGTPFPSSTMFSVEGGNFSLETGESHFFDITFNPMENYGYSGAFLIEGYGNCNSTTVSVSGTGVIHWQVTTQGSNGTTTGDGLYEAGETCCLNAIPDLGYIFNSWEEFPLSGGGNIFTPEHCYSVLWWHGDYNWNAYFFPFTFQIRVNLSGSYNGTDMNAYPNPDNFPLNQPYNTPPWNYGGDENVASLPNANIVDWVLVELRDPVGDVSTAFESTRVARQAAFLLKDGSVVGLDGYSNLFFEIESSSNFHVVIWHRNHLGIISANPIIGTTIGYDHYYSYDFTDNSDKAYGGGLAQKEIAYGIWGMIGADGDANGSIDELDLALWGQTAGKSGYLKGDFDLNGQIENMDKNEIWSPSNGSSSQIPVNTFNCGDILFDCRDDQSYATVQIGTQCWMAENLNFGNRVDFAIGQENNGFVEKFCFNNENDSCTIYGGIYQWDESMEYISTEGSQGICPEGWHVPTDVEWCVLENEVDSGTIPCGSEGWRGADAGGNMKETGFDHWSQPNSGATNSSSFTGLPAGYFNFSQDDILGLGLYSQYWTSTEFSANNPWMRGLHYSKTTIRRINQSKDYGLSIRCVKD